MLSHLSLWGHGFCLESLYYLLYFEGMQPEGTSKYRPWLSFTNNSHLSIGCSYSEEGANWSKIFCLYTLNQKIFHTVYKSKYLHDISLQVHGMKITKPAVARDKIHFSSMIQMYNLTAYGQWSLGFCLKPMFCYSLTLPTSHTLFWTWAYYSHFTCFCPVFWQVVEQGSLDCHKLDNMWLTLHPTLDVSEHCSGCKWHRSLGHCNTAFLPCHDSDVSEIQLHVHQGSPAAPCHLVRIYHTHMLCLPECPEVLSSHVVLQL